MADLSADWSTKSNDALSVSLVTPASGSFKTVSTFHPKFTYPIFGDEETIFGYQGLKINLRYHACDMRPNLQIAYNKKFKPIGETSATDIKATLEGFLPQTAFDKSSIFDTSINDEIYKNWRPPGVLHKKLDAEDKTIEVWKGNLSDKAIQQLVKRIQILIPLFIEGGQAINLSDPEWSLRRWTVFLLYQKRINVEDPSASPYIFMGYSTVYRYFHYPLPTPPSSPVSKQLPSSKSIDSQPFQFPIPEESSFELPCRSRISQFLILPPFQGSGNGSRFYEAIFNYYLNHPQTVEITVEDPNEAFDDLRDVNDLERLRNILEFTSLRIKTDITVSKKGRVPTGKIVDLAAIEALRRKMKIAPRQFMRLVEMQLLTLIPTYIRKSLILEKKQGTAAEIKVKEHEYHLWQLFVKQRLYRHNKDTLIQLDRAERIDKLEDAADNVEADYGRLLRMLEQRTKKTLGPADGVGKSRNGKRNVEMDGHGDGIEGEPSTKKVRITEE